MLLIERFYLHVIVWLSTFLEISSALKENSSWKIDYIIF